MNDIHEFLNIQGTGLLQANDVARILNISRSLAYRILKRGEIPTIRIGTAVRVRESDLITYIQKHWSGWRDES